MGRFKIAIIILVILAILLLAFMVIIPMLLAGTSGAMQGIYYYQGNEVSRIAQGPLAWVNNDGQPIDSIGVEVQYTVSGANVEDIRVTGDISVQCLDAYGTYTEISSTEIQEHQMTSASETKIFTWSLNTLLANAEPDNPTSEHYTIKVVATITASGWISSGNQGSETANAQWSGYCIFQIGTGAEGSLVIDASITPR